MGENAQEVTNQKPPLREEVERELRVRAWKDEAFRQELIANPRGVIERLFPHCFPDGKVPDKLTYKVIEEDAYTHHILLPALPDELTNEISEERLEEIIDETEQVWGGVSYETIITCSCSCYCSRTRICGG